MLARPTITKWTLNNGGGSMRCPDAASRLLPAPRHGRPSCGRAARLVRALLFCSSFGGSAGMSAPASTTIFGGRLLWVSSNCMKAIVGIMSET